MNVTLIEPFFTGSHAAWAQGYAQHSAHNVNVLSLPGNYWKWRMHGGAVTLARRFLETGERPDLLFVTDMLDLTTFLALTRPKSADIPVAIYFHENQLCYPWSPTSRDKIHKRDRHYSFINYVSALAADAVFFNSSYHKNAFLDKLPAFLRESPDLREIETVEAIRAKSKVLHLGLDLQKFDRVYSEEKSLVSPESKHTQAPLILWNHRWEYDKNPDEFFRVLFELDDRRLDFRVALLGETLQRNLPIFETARKKLGEKIVRYGYAEDFEQYARWLHKADFLPITSIQDFFGASIVEAVYCGCYPLLPRRLSYPGLFPPERFPEIFYDDTQNLVEKLAGAVQESKRRKQYNLRACVEQYSWQNIVSTYDEQLSYVTNSKPILRNRRSRVVKRAGLDYPAC